MRYKDTPKKRKLKASNEIREKYAIKPIIALYRDEADAIFDNVLDEDMLPEFYVWLEEWSKFIFKEANFIIKSRSARGSSVYLAYRVSLKKLVVTIFSDDSEDSAEIVIDPEFVDIENGLAGIASIDYRGNPTHKISLPVSSEYFVGTDEEINTLIKDSHEREEKFKKEEAEIGLEIKKMPTNDGIRELLSDESRPMAERKAIAMEAYNLAQRNLDITGKIRDELLFRTNSIDEIIKDTFLNGAARVSLIVLATLYYFQIRVPKTYLPEQVGETEGYKRHNDLYNPIKRLNPPAIVRPKNGTRSWFETQRMKHTESWHVKGHSRVLKADRYKEKRGQTIWVNPFIKGSGENMRLSIYADKIAGEDVVEVDSVPEELSIEMQQR